MDEPATRNTIHCQAFGCNKSFSDVGAIDEVRVAAFEAFWTTFRNAPNYPITLCSTCSIEPLIILADRGSQSEAYKLAKAQRASDCARDEEKERTAQRFHHNQLTRDSMRLSQNERTTINEKR